MPAVDKTKKDAMAPRRTLRKVWPEDVPIPPPVVEVVASMTIGQYERRAHAPRKMRWCIALEGAPSERVGGRAIEQIQICAPKDRIAKV